MVRKGWMVFAGAMALGVVLGCSSNPYRPTLFQRNKNRVNGPELGTPMTDGSYLGGDPSGYPMRNASVDGTSLLNNVPT